MKIRVPGRVVDFLLNGQTAADLRGGRIAPGERDIADVIEALWRAPRLADDARSIEVTEPRLAVLAEYGDYLVVAASDDAGSGDMSGLADVNAGRAMIRRVAKARQS